MRSQLEQDMWNEDLMIDCQEKLEQYDKAPHNPSVYHRRRELEMARSLLLRDDPGGDDAFGVTAGRHQWRREFEWRLLYPAREHERALWAFKISEVEYLLAPEGEQEKLVELARRVAQRARPEATQLRVHLVATDPAADPEPSGELADWT